jgi:DNA-binding HxlR family transcriptional regulator
VKGKRKSFECDSCPIARSLDAIGDWWSLLIIRDALAGKRRFGEFQKSLGLAKNILSARLRKLVARDILQAVPIKAGSSHHEYVLSEKGKRLQVVLIALWQWSEAALFAPGERDGVLCDRKKGAPLPKIDLRAKDGRVLGPGDTMVRRDLCPRISQPKSRTTRHQKPVALREKRPSE